MTKFFIEHDFPFDAVKSNYFMKFIEKLRPAYKLPDPATMSTKILEDIHQEAVSKAVSGSLKEAGFLFASNPLGSITIFLKPFYEKSFRFAEIESAVFATMNDFKTFLRSLSESALQKFNYDVLTVTADCVEFELSDDLQQMMLRTHNQAVDKLLERSQDVSLLSEVLAVLNIFEIDVPFCFEAWNFQLMACEFYLKEHLSMIEKLLVNKKVDSDIREKLYSSNFKNRIENVKGNIEIASKLTGKYDFLSDIISDWLHIYQSTALIAENDDLYSSVFNKIGLLAYSFDPKFKGQDLSPSQKTTCSFLVLKKLSDPSEFKLFCDYRENKGIFATSDLDSLPTELYWKVVAPACPKLSKLALMYSSFAPFIDQKEENSKVSLGSDIEEKIAFIKSFL